MFLPYFAFLNEEKFYKKGKSKKFIQHLIDNT